MNEKICTLCGESFSRIVKNEIWRFRRKRNFRVKIFRKTFNMFFSNIERKNFGWLSKKSQRHFQGALYHSIGTFWRKYFWKEFASFVDCFRINSGNWAGKIWPVCQNCILSIYRNIFRKKNCFGKQMNFFTIFRHWAEFFGLLSIFLAGLIKVHSTCPKELHWGKKYIFQNTDFSIIFGQKTEIFQVLSEKVQPWLSKMKIAGATKRFRKIFFS